jgi:hypothetical protein
VANNNIETHHVHFSSCILAWVCCCGQLQKHVLLSQNHPEEELKLRSLMVIVKDAVDGGGDVTFVEGVTVTMPVDEPEF